MLNRTSAPIFEQNFSFRLPEPQVVQLTDRIDFIFFPGLQQEIFKLEIVYKAGKWYEPKLGVYHFTAIMLDKGTKHKSSRKIAELLDFLGAQIEISPGADFTSISLYGLKKYFKETLSLFLEILKDPVFPPDELDLQKDIFIQTLKINNEKNSFFASKAIRKNIFGTFHPYGSSMEENDVSNITQDDLVNYFKSNFSPHEIYLIGNIDDALIKWLQENLSFSSMIIPEREMFVIKPGPSSQDFQRPQSVQSSIRLGKRTINRNHKDYFSLILLNHILGGYFGSRLMKNIREKKGLTYGIYSSVTPFKNDAMFSIGADVSKDKVELTLLEIKKEISSLIDEFVPEEEFKIAKNHFLGSLLLEVSNPFSSLDKVKSIRQNQLGNFYYDKLISTVKEEKASHLRAAAEEHLSALDLAVVTVG